MKRELLEEEMSLTVGKEAITLSSLMTFLAIGVVSVIYYKFFNTEKGKASLPGGFSFTWG